MAKTRLSSKYQIVIPKEIREKLKLKSGTDISVFSVDETHAIIMKRPKDYVAAMEGLGKEVWQALGGADKYIKEQRASWGNR